MKACLALDRAPKARRFVLPLTKRIGRWQGTRPQCGPGRGRGHRKHLVRSQRSRHRNSGPGAPVHSFGGARKSPLPTLRSDRRGLSRTLLEPDLDVCCPAQPSDCRGNLDPLFSASSSSRSFSVPKVPRPTLTGWLIVWGEDCQCFVDFHSGSHA